MPISSHPEPNDAEREQELTLIGRLTSPDAFVAAAQPIELIVSVEKRAETTNVSRAQTECTCENKEKNTTETKFKEVGRSATQSNTASAQSGTGCEGNRHGKCAP